MAYRYMILAPKAISQISKTVLSNWKKGEVYQIPFGVGHASGNFGYTPQYTVSFTAVIKD